MGVKNNIRLALLFVCLMVVGIALYPYIPRLVKIAQAVQGELKFGAAMDQEMRVVNKTYYSNDLFFGNGAGGTIGILKGIGNVGIGTTAPTDRLDVWGNITARTTGVAPGNPIMKTGFLGNAGGYLDILADNVVRVHLSSWSGAGNSYIYPLGGGNLGIGTTAPTKTLDVVGDINFSGTLYQGGAAFTGSKWTNTTGGIYYNSGNVGVGSSAPSTTLDVNGSFKWQDVRYYKISRAWGQNLNDWGEVGSFANTGVSQYAVIKLQGHWCGSIISSTYKVNSAAYGGTSTGWIQLPKLDGGGSYWSQDAVAVDVRNQNPQSTSSPFEIRLRNTQAMCGGTSLNVYVETNTAFTPTTGTGIGGTVENGFLGSTNWSFPVSNARGWTSATEGMFVTNTGNVGIGTTNPTKKLDIVAANSTINNTSGNLSIVPSANLLITQGNVGVGTTAPTYKLHVAGSARTQDVDIASSGNYSTGATRLGFGSADNPGLFDLYYVGDTLSFRNSWGSMRDQFVLSRSGGTLNAWFTGNVGIGTTSPTQKLHIASGNLLLSTTTAGGDLLISGGGSNEKVGLGSWTVGGLHFYSTCSGCSDGLGNGITGTAIDGSIQLYPRSGGMVVKGNVGIGTTVPGSKLHVAGEVTLPTIKQNTDVFNGTDITSDGITRTVYFNPPGACNSPAKYFKIARAKITGNYQSVVMSGQVLTGNHIDDEDPTDFYFKPFTYTTPGTQQYSYYKNGVGAQGEIEVYSVANGGGANTYYYDVYIKMGWCGPGWATLDIRPVNGAAVTVWQTGLDSGTTTPTGTLLTTNANFTFDVANVGIGTTAPAQKLSVAGVIESTSGGVKFPDGTTQTTAATGGGTGPDSVQVFTTSGTWTKPAGITKVVVEITGGGGGGGGAAGDTQYGASGYYGGKGGAGGFCRKIVDVSAVSTVAVTIGAGGTGGNRAYGANNDSTAGTAGGASSFGTYSTANGGAGGCRGQSGCGGAGGTCASGDVAVTGDAGSPGWSPWYGQYLGRGLNDAGHGGNGGECCGNPYALGNNGYVGTVGKVVVWQYR